MLLIKKIFFLNFWRFGKVDFNGLEFNLKLNSIIDVPSNFLYAADPFQLDKLILFEGITLEKPIGKIYRYDKGNVIPIVFDSNYKNKHMSFPFLISINGLLLLIPQITGTSKLTIFKFDNESNSASYYKDILLGCDCRDSVIIEYDGHFVLFCSIVSSSGITEFKIGVLDRDFNLMYFLDFPSYGREFRCAGRPFVFNNEYYLPVQSAFPRYGSGIKLYKFQISLANKSIDFNHINDFSFISPVNNLNGFHTYNIDKTSLFIDFRFSKFSLFAFIIKLRMLIARFPFERIQLSNLLLYISLKIFNWIVKLPKWHLNSLLIYPKYYDVLLNILCKYSIDSVIEVGSGLGEISKLKRFESYCGVDIDLRVVKVAKFLGRNVVSNISYELMLKSEAVLLINFLHTMTEEEVVNTLVTWQNSKYLIIDEIHMHAIEYRYKHVFEAILSSKYVLLERVQVESGKRDLLIFMRNS